ncbi:hypothetical protein [Escherichia coli]|uniref:hypothetical protein n=2 Tax=Escherichia coli TaxID=562 RepID=UPI000BB689CC|nr:hypothetical protein [Escherichia coli]PBT75440.1 hypothetical protein BBJ17_19850 [Escherichia coli]
MALPRILTTPAAPAEDDSIFYAKQGENDVHDNTMDNPSLIELGLHPRLEEIRKPVRAYLRKGAELGKIYFHAGNKIDNLTELGPKELRLFLLGNIHHYCTTVDDWLTLFDIYSWFATQDVPERQVLLKMLDELDDVGYIRTRRVTDPNGRPHIEYSSTSWIRNALPLDRLFKEYYTDIRSLRNEREILQFLVKLTKRRHLKIKPLHGDVFYYMILVAVWVQMGITPPEYYVRTSEQISVALGISDRAAREILSGLFQSGLLDRLQLNGKEYAYGVNTDIFYKEPDAPVILKELTFESGDATEYCRRYGSFCEILPSERFLYGKVDKGEQEENI